jgi:hypothetical protein
VAQVPNPFTLRNRPRLQRLLAVAATAAFITAAISVSLARTAPGSRLSPPLSIAAGSNAWSIQAPSDNLATVVPSPGRPGQNALRLQVLPGHAEAVGHSSADRTDAMIGAALTDAVEGREQWWAWSTYFPSDYNPTPSTAWNLFLDFHDTSPSGQANINFLVNAHFNPPVLQMTVYGGPSPDGAPQTTRRLAVLRLNSWYDFILHVVWSSNPHIGLVEVFLNGRELGRPLHAATLYSGQGAYLKIANYREAGPAASAILTAGVRRVRSLAAAADGFSPFDLWARRLTVGAGRG